MALEVRKEDVSLDKCNFAVISVLGELVGLFAQGERTEGAGLWLESIGHLDIMTPSPATNLFDMVFNHTATKILL